MAKTNPNITAQDALYVKISNHSNETQISCVNLQVLLDSIVDKLDSLGDLLCGMDVKGEEVFAHFNAINCYATCASKSVEDVLASTLNISDEAFRAKA